mmetsp:Transcript_3555/g.6829  ORF Transcript_3555/g.6829 Transcript_3555/m.6829 type:complete len:105 (-) Transcript_3555:1509-1823(-)
MWVELHKSVLKRRHCQQGRGGDILFSEPMCTAPCPNLILLETLVVDPHLNSDHIHSFIPHSIPSNWILFHVHASIQRIPVAWSGRTQEFCMSMNCVSSNIIVNE